MTAALCLIAIAVLIAGYFVDINLWSISASRILGSAIFFPLIAVGVITFLVTAFRRETDPSNDDSPSPNIITAGVIIAIAGAIVIWFTSSGQFFWRNVFSGPISILGSYSHVIQAYSDLPPDFNLVDLWQQTAFQRILGALLGAIYIFLTALLTKEVFESKATRFLAFLFVVTTGIIAVFSRPGDFAVMLVLMMLDAYLTVLFFKGKASFYLLVVVLLISVIFHPVFVLFALSILYVRLSGKLLSGGKAGMPILMLIGIAIIGALLSLLQIEPFISVFRPETSASPLFGFDQIWGFFNQMMMVSHIIWLLALITCVYAFVSARVRDLHGILFGAWFITSSSFYIFSYSHYGWVFGHSGAVIVILPSVLWLAWFLAAYARGQTQKALTMLIIVNILTTIPLLAAVNSNDKAVDLYADVLSREHAFDKSFDDGKGALLMGIMFSEELEDYDRALPYLESYNKSYPLDPVGRYHYGWTLTNIDGKLVKGVDVLKKLEKHLTETGKLFWEFNYRIGWKRVVGHNFIYGSISLERAAAEKNTPEITELLASAYENMKIWDSMSSKYEQMINWGDSTKENFFKVANGAALNNDTAKAIKYFKYGIEHYPDYLANYEYIARYYFLTKKYDSLEMLAERGLKYIGYSPELEASMILVYHYTNRLKQRDSLYEAFMDYFQTYPTALQDWGVFLEENGLVYQGRKMQAADLTTENANLRAILGFYQYYKLAGMADSAKALIDRFIDLDSAGEFSRVTAAVRDYDTILWPDDKYRRHPDSSSFK